ncbi:phospholipase A1-like [Bacillus rossius redtenbacheri]|uniref:phospholipase A1-like n=1 Tax=Bacillus rossius redtenbacheri TaxID=93214 RepID=UPI002FDE1E32
MLANFVAAIFLLAGSSVIAEDPADTVKFQLYERTSEHAPLELDHELTGFNASKPTILIIHGFGGSSKAKSALIIKDAVLATRDWNAVLADWAQLASSERPYEAAVKGTQAAGSAVARFVRSLLALPGAARSDLVLAGFSLGAHVAGVAAARLAPLRLARIVALDAAGPLYKGKDAADKLDAGDADFVMAIHTSADFYGTDSRVGHADFRPNGGRSPQPPCVHDEVKDVCSHFMAPVLFAESVYNPTAFLATKCGSWAEYTADKCPREKVYMGLETPATTRGDFFLRTRAAPPFGESSPGRRVVLHTPQELESDDGLLDDVYDQEEAEVTVVPAAAGSAPAAASAQVLLVLSAATAVSAFRR